MDILSPEQLKLLMNLSAKDELKRAVKLLFRKGDIVEVRAWDKAHAIYTGRYKYGKTLIDMLELFDGEGCDVYYVLNPVGDKHGLRTMESGGLCTWENDVPFRRRFLLDFDPRRDNKIATNEQWDDAYNTAVRAMTWLQSYGYKGIVLASSGNGCHLLVPCNLPNDPASKELVRKVQRAVSEKFSTSTVECECFPDANRLVRAYGSTNKKGTPTEEMRHRLSGILRMPNGEDDDPKGMMEAIVKDNPIADAKKHNLGTGTGPFSRDLLYARLEAWQEGWEGTVDVGKLLADDEVLDIQVEEFANYEPPEIANMSAEQRQGMKEASDKAKAYTARKQAIEDDNERAEPVIVNETLPEPKKRLTNMPESCMYGWLGHAARELETPLGFAYPAMLTAFAAQIQVYPRHIRPTLYTCLIGPVHCGKSETIKRATQYLHFNEPGAVKWTVPGSDRGLLKIFGDKKKDDREKKEDAVGLEVPKARLLAQDELRNTIAKANIQGSSLPATLCTLWSMDEAGAADKTGEHTATVKLNILGALKADDAEDFAEVFGKDSTAGLYDRFIYGVASKGWQFQTWEREMQYRSPKGCMVPAHCYQRVNEWRDAEPVGRGRLAEIALRVAYITASANHDTEVTVEAVEAALEFCEWQEFIRAGYKAGLGDSVDALCTNAILTVLEKLEPGAWIKWKTIAGAKNWYRKFGSRVLSATRDALSKSGHTIEETIEDEDGHPKRTGRLRLRVDSD